jgi:hypothetical protein
VTGVLSIIQGGSLPPARARLVDLHRRIIDSEKHLSTLCNGRDRLRSELSRADSARNELDSLVMEDASSLVGKLRSGANWALSTFGSARALNLVAALSESRVQQEVGSKALAAVSEEIAVLERELADLQGRKQDAILSVLREASAGYVADVAAIADELRQVLSIISGLDKLTAKPTGEWLPDRRVVVTIPSVGGIPETAIVAPASTIERAQNIWREFAAELDADPLATVEHLEFPIVSGHEDDGKIIYSELSRAERQNRDLEHALGTK